MVELVTLLVIMGIVAAVALPRFFDLGAFANRGFYDAALAATRFAQKHAVATGCNIRIQFSSMGYALSRDNICTGTTFGQNVRGPDGSPSFSDTKVPSGLAIGNADIYFDAAGRPRNPATGTVLTAPVDIGIGSRVIRVEPESGYAHAP